MLNYKNIMLMSAIALMGISSTASADTAKRRHHSSSSSESSCCGCDKSVLQFADDTNFGDTIANGTYVVLFSSSSDARGFAKVFGKICTRFQNPTEFVIVDVDASPVTATQHTVLETPTVVIFVDGQEVARSSGFNKPKDLSNFIYGTFGGPVIDIPNPYWELP